MDDRIDIKVNETGGPKCLVIAGPNGAGKTTFAMKYLPMVGFQNFINADMISQGLCDLTICYDNTDARPVPVFRQDDRGIRVIDANRYDAFMRCYHD